MKKLLVTCLLVNISLTGTASSQSFNPAPVMTTPVSAEANGTGGISASIISENALASAANPAQLGIFSLANYFNASTFITNTALLPGSGTGNSLHAAGVNAGVNLEKYLKTPIPVSFGLGYSRIQLTLAQFEVQWINGPQVISTWNASQTLQNLTISLGTEYWVRFGIGYNLKWINSTLAPFYPAGEVPTGRGKAVAHDYGILLEIPSMAILSRLQHHNIKFGRNIFPIVDLSFAYTRRNIGDGIYYLDPSQTQPFSREATLGLSAVFGLKSEVHGRVWTLISFTWAREAQDNLVSVSSTPTPLQGGDTLYTNVVSYTSGLGDIDPIDNLIFGRTNGNVELRRGWQLQLAEFLYLRGGSFTGESGPDYSTLGFGLRLDGLVKILAAYDLVDIDRPGIYSFIVDHLDLQYDYSEYTGDSYATGTNFQSLNLVVR